MKNKTFNIFVKKKCLSFQKKKCAEPNVYSALNALLNLEKVG